LHRLLKVLFAIVLVASMGVSGRAETTRHPTISVADNSYDFGFIPIDYRVSHTFYVKNTGDDVLEIDKVVQNCDCTTSELESNEIPPGDSTELTMVFHTKNYYGQTTRTLTIYSNDPANPEYDLSYTAELGLLPRYFKTNPISLIILPSKKQMKMYLLNLSDDNISYDIEYQSLMHFSIDKTAGDINARDSVEITVIPAADIPPGTFYNNFTILYKDQQTVRLTVPIKIVKY